MKVIAYIYTDFPEKFGIPRQSGLVEELKGRIVFEPEYRNSEAVKGLDGFNYIWLLWQFQGTERAGWSATVKPPRLGGKKHMGVFATRSPFRPNPIGLSSVKLLGVEKTAQGSVLHVSGADLMDGTPIYDIKPYLAFTDSHPDAVGGFADAKKEYALQVDFPKELLAPVPVNKQKALLELLSEDPRPQYIEDPERIYGFVFANLEIKFSVANGVLTVKEVTASDA